MNRPSQPLSDDLLTRWIDGEITPAEASLIEQYLAEMPELLREKQSAESLGALLREHFPSTLEPPSPDFFNRSVITEIGSGSPARSISPVRTHLPSWLRWMGKPWAGPLASAAVVATAFLMWNGRTARPGADDVAQTYAPDPRVTANVFYSEAARATVIDLQNLDAVPDDRDIKAFDVASAGPARHGEPLVLHSASDTSKPVLVLSRDGADRPRVTAIP